MSGMKLFSNHMCSMRFRRIVSQVLSELKRNKLEPKLLLLYKRALDARVSPSCSYYSSGWYVMNIVEHGGPTIILSGSLAPSIAITP